MKKVFSRSHPYLIFTYLYKFAFLFIFPLIQTLIFTPINTVEIVLNLSINLLFVLSIVFVAILKYRNKKYKLFDDFFYYKNGLIKKSTFKIPYKNCTSIYIQKSILPLIFSAFKVYIDTCSYKDFKSDIMFILSIKNAEKFFYNMFKVHLNIVFKYRSSFLKVLIMSISWSNSIVGILFFAPFVSRSGSILGQEFSKNLYAGVNVAVYIASIGLPPATAYIAGFLVFGFFIALFMQIFRYANFKSTVKGDVVITKRGFINKSIFATRTENINVISINQTLLMMLLKVKITYMYTVGIGKLKGDKSLLIACEHIEKVCKILENLIGIKVDEIVSIKPKFKKIKNFIYLPIICILMVVPIYYILLKIGIYREFLHLGLLLSFTILFIWFVFRIFAYKKTSLAITKDNYVIARGFKRMNLSENIIKSNKIQYTILKQSFFQKKNKTCHIYIYVYGERRKKYIVKHLEFGEVLDFIIKLKRI